ncbi:MAG: flagella basal body P-ring formation protein FlgA [Actinomycetales bacterium]|nr:flagella basal body P-ring formation protein FlgA [Actinomycetales bacterium]
MPLNNRRRTVAPHWLPSDAAGTLATLRQHLLRARARATLGGIALVVLTALATAAVTHVENKAVIVATHDLPAGHIIGAGDITWREVPARAAPRHAMTVAAQAIGRRLVGPIARTDVLSQERVAATPTAPSNALRMTLGIDNATARALAAGDTVDVWVVSQAMGGVSETGAQRAAHAVTVVEVSVERESTATASVTLSVPAADVPALVAARAEGAAVMLTRRP